MSEGSSNDTWKKGCAIAAAVVIILGCCGFIIGGVACGSFFNFGQETALNDVSLTLHTAVQGNPREAEYASELVRFDEVRGHIGLMTFGVLSNRYNDARADGTIDASELDHMMELIHDINEGNGEVDYTRYPGGR